MYGTTDFIAKQQWPPAANSFIHLNELVVGTSVVSGAMDQMNERTNERENRGRDICVADDVDG